MKITIPGAEAKALAPFDHELGRTTVFLGANGTGKTKLLNEIVTKVSAQVGQKNVLQLSPVGVVQNQKFSLSGPSDPSEQQLLQQHKSSFSGSVIKKGVLNEAIVFNALNKLDFDRKSEEMKLYRLHRENPKENRLFPEAKSVFDEVCEFFNEIAEVRLKFDAENGTFSVSPQKFTAPDYQVSELSSGESWIFRILPTFIKFQEDPIVLFVDEPETALNEQLAVDFWTFLEDSRPNWRFVYATHNVNFAARDNVDDIFMTRSPAEEPVKISSVADLAPDEKRKLLGTGPRLSVAPKALFVEGKNSSVDVPFYQAILDDGQVLVSSIGSSNDVKKAVDQSGYWERLHVNTTDIVGCIDRDYNRIVVESEKIAMLDLHDAEAYLCLPGLLTKIASKTAGETNCDPYVERIVKHAEDHKLATIFRHLDKKFPIGNGFISVPKSERVVEDVAEIPLLYSAKRNGLLAQLASDVTDDVIGVKFREITRSIDAAIEEKDIVEILKWFSGKSLFNNLKDLAEIRSTNQAIKLIRQNHFVCEIAELAALRDKLRRKMNIETDTN